MGHAVADSALIQQTLEICRGQWPSVQWSEDQIKDALYVAGLRFCKRLEVALKLDNIVPDATVSVDKDGFHVASNVPNVCQAGTALTFEGLAAQVAACCGQPPLQQVADEFQCSFMNDAMSILFQCHVWHARNASNLWEFVYEEHCMGVEESLDFWEQFAGFLGHPRHVMSKTKMHLVSQKPLELSEVCKYSPEFGTAVHPYILVVQCDVMVAYPSAESWQKFWMEHHPDAVSALAKQVGAAHVNEYLLSWVHPLNCEHLQHTLRQFFDDGSMWVLDGDLAKGQPTLSLRTLAMREGYHVKLPVPLQITSQPRYLPPVEIEESVALSEIIQTFDLPKALVILLETQACHASYASGTRAASYGQASYCSMLVRESPALFVQEGHRLLPLAAAFSPTPSGRSLFADVWASSGIDRRNILSWFASYTAVVAGSQITPFLRYGFTIEAHQQNGMIELTRDGWPARLFCREIGGGIEWDEARFKAFPGLDSRHLCGEHCDVFVPGSVVRALLRYTMLESHLLPLAEICSANFDIEVECLHDIIRAEVTTCIESVQPASEDTWSTMQLQDYASSLKFSLLEEKFCRRKALLRMRVENTTDYIFSEQINRLAPKASVSGYKFAEETALLKTAMPV
jgi:siderophore synthetase component